MLRSFGKVTVAAAGTPVRCTVNEPDPTKLVKIQSLSLYALSGNSGTNIYLGSATMNKSTLAEVYAIASKGTWAAAIVQNSPDAIAVSDLYLDADTSGDAALVSGTEQ